MLNAHRYFVVLVMATLLPLSASAEIYRCMNATGKVTYSLTPPTTPCHAQRFAAQARPATTARTQVNSANFPRVDIDTQQARDMRRRQILEAELETELQLRKAANAEDVAVHHERNILALRKEISFLR